MDHIDENLRKYFDQREARPEFFENDFYQERNQMPSMKQNKKAKSIYLSGAVKHVKALQKEIEFCKGWKPRQQQFQMPVQENQAIKLAQLKFNNRVENQNPIAKFITKTNNDLDKGIQVSQSSMMMQTGTINILPKTNYLHEIEQLSLISAPIIKNRDKEFNPMIASKNLNNKYTFFTLRNGAEQNSQSSSLQNQKSLDLILATCKQPIQNKKYHKSKNGSIPEEANINHRTLNVSKKRIQQYYNKINGL